MSVILSAHVLLALASILILCSRSVLAFQNRWLWANHKLLLLASAFSTLLLLISAFILMFWHEQYVFFENWVSEKLLWLVLYVLFGVLALLPKLPAGVRAMSFALACVCFTLAFAVAKSHIPFVLSM